VLLTERADIWRLLPVPSKPGRSDMKVWRRNVLCHLEPISSVDLTVPFALQSTHVIYLPYWVTRLRHEDEIRLSGFVAADGTRVARRYVVKGIRRFGTFGLRHIAAYCEERE
jgi:hypothetical protein